MKVLGSQDGSGWALNREILRREEEQRVADLGDCQNYRPFLDPNYDAAPTI